MRKNSVTSATGAEPRGGQRGPWPHLNFFVFLYIYVEYDAN
jgi:hypothetical protein